MYKINNAKIDYKIRIIYRRAFQTILNKIHLKCICWTLFNALIFIPKIRTLILASISRIASYASTLPPNTCSSRVTLIFAVIRKLTNILIIFRTLVIYPLRTNCGITSTLNFSAYFDIFIKQLPVVIIVSTWLTHLYYTHSPPYYVLTQILL